MGRRKVKCDSCGRTFKSKSGLMLHLRHGCKGERGKEVKNVDVRSQVGNTVTSDVSIPSVDMYQTKQQSVKASGQNVYQDNKMRSKSNKGKERDEQSKVLSNEVVYNENMNEATLLEAPNVLGANNDGRRRRRPVISWKCNQCNAVFDYRRELNLHNRTFHNPNHSLLQEVPWGQGGIAPWELPNKTVVHPELRDVYNKHKSYILDSHYTPPMDAIYNFPIDNTVNVDILMEKIQYVFDNRGNAFRLNLSFGIILQNTETDELVYYRPYSNALVFERAMYVSRRADLRRVKRRMVNLDILQYMLNQRPNTKYAPVLITNVRVWIWDLDYPLLGYVSDIRKFPWKRLKCLYPLVSKLSDNRHYYRDRKCAFRCVAIHRHSALYNKKTQKLFERKVDKYFHEWLQYKGIREIDFVGVHMGDMLDFETCFEINIDIYERMEEKITQLKYKSCGKYKSQMDLNIWEYHLSYIHNLELFSSSFQCQNCFKMFHTSHALKVHSKSQCNLITEYIFKGGYYENVQTVFEALEFVGIYVQEDERFQEDFLVFDFESILLPTNTRKTDKLMLVSKHIPVSVAVCGTLPEQQQGLFILRDNEKDLIHDWIDQLSQWSHSIRMKAYRKWGWILMRLQYIMNNIRVQLEIPEEEYCLPIEGMNLTGDEYGHSIADFDDQYKKYKLKHLERLYERMKRYIDEVIVLSYNSSRYDINLVKKHLPVELGLCNSKKGMVIKRNNQYNCISSGEMLFLDVTNFLASGISYEAFLKAYDVGISKKFFPYEYLTSFNVLFEEHLPLPFSGAWYSKLKGRNVLGDTDEDIQSNFNIVLKAWDDNKMTNLGSLLAWYNLDDTVPMVIAIRKMYAFYKSKGLDIFKDAISLSGVGRRWLFQSAKKMGVTFALFDNSSKDIYGLIRSHVVGGPSIIFERFVQCGKSMIHNNPDRIVKEIIGYDCCSMYAKALSMDMPVGGFVRRKEEENFKPIVRDKYLLAYYWMDYIAETEGITINHKLNVGKEFRCASFLADGHCPEEDVIFEFFGCFFHGHKCHLSLSLTDSERELRWNRHMKKLKYISKYYTVRSIYECEFKKQCSLNEKLKSFVQKRRPEFFQKHKGPVSTQMILEAIEEDSLFGVALVDIEVPDQWPHGKERDISPYDYFKEMSPIYCTTKVPFEAIGSHMQEHVNKYNLSKKPRTLLVGGMKAQKILLASKLIKWYIDHGMVVTRVYQVIEFCRSPCFASFINEVKEARRKADLCEATKINAMSFKLLANASFGSLLLQKCKHRNVKFVQGIKAAKNCVNNTRFCSLNTLSESDQVYEVENYKKAIKMDTPIACGYMVLQYAKLIHNIFYYDFLCEFLQPGSFCMLQCDTDSAYICISGEKLIDIVKPNRLNEFKRLVYGSCDDKIQIVPGVGNRYIARECCEKHNKYDSKEPGIYKEEMRGVKEGIGLSSKSYLLITDKKIEPCQTPLSVLKSRVMVNKAMKLKCQSLYRKVKWYHTKPQKREVKWYFKLVSKGVSKRNVRKPVYIYRHVIRTQERMGSVNKGIRLWDNSLYTYMQNKLAFSYYYCKREVDQNGSSTRPLNIVLQPIQKSLGNIHFVDRDSNKFDNILVDME